jgi:hypothetical protein
MKAAHCWSLNTDRTCTAACSAQEAHNLHCSTVGALFLQEVQDLAEKDYPQDQSATPVDQLNGTVEDIPAANFQNMTRSLDLKILMGPKEKQLFDQMLSRGTNYFEFGVGGSTLFASRHGNLQHITAVDSSRAWIAKVESEAPIAADIQRGRVSIQHVDLGDVNTYGYPLAPNAAQERAYSKAIVGATPVPDLVLVDGRYRVACALQTALEAVEKDWPRLVLLIHDYERSEYSQYVNALLGPPSHEQGSPAPGGYIRTLAAWELSGERLKQIKGDAALLARMRAQLQRSENIPHFLDRDEKQRNASSPAQSEAKRSVLL